MNDAIIGRSTVQTFAITLSLQFSHAILAEMVVHAVDARHSSACNGNICLELAITLLTPLHMDCDKGAGQTASMTEILYTCDHV